MGKICEKGSHRVDREDNHVPNILNVGSVTFLHPLTFSVLIAAIKASENFGGKQLLLVAYNFLTC